MAYTLAQVNNLTTDLFIQGVAQDRMQRNPILAELRFETVSGTQVTWNRQSTTGSLSPWATATFTQIGGALSESTPSTTQVSATLAQLVDSSRVARFAIEAKSDINDILQYTISEKVNALFDTFQTHLFYGNNNTNSNQFDGLHRWVDNTLDTNLEISEAASALNLANLNLMIQANRGPTHLVMNGNIWARMSQATYLGGTVGSATAQNIQAQYGGLVQAYGGAKVVVSDYLTMTETDADPPVATGSSNASILALNLGGWVSMSPTDVLYAQGPTVIQSAMGPHIVEPFPVGGESTVEIQFYWFVGVITPTRRTIGRVRGITDAAIAA